MSSSFIKIAHKELQNMTRENGASEVPEQCKQEIARLREIIAYQEAKIAHLYAETTKYKSEIEARERACQEKEQKIATFLAKFSYLKDRVAKAMKNTEHAGDVATPKEEEETKGSDREVREQGESQKIFRHLEIITASLKHAWQRIKNLEETMKDETREHLRRFQQASEDANTGFSRSGDPLPDIPFGYTPDINSDIYLRGEPISFHRESPTSSDRNNLETLIAELGSTRQYLHEASKLIRNNGGNHNKESKTQDILLACEELQNLLDSE